MESQTMQDKGGMRGTRWLVFTVVGLLSLNVEPVSAQSFYCCVDDKGHKLCADRLPARCVGKPHTVRGPDGRTREIAGWMTPEERKAKEEAEERRKEAEILAAEERRQDRALLATYGSESDIDAAEERAEQELRDAITQAEKRVEAANKRRKKFEDEAEFYKRKQLPDEVRRGLRDADYEAKAQTELIDLKRKDLEGVKEKYAVDRKRFRDLTQFRRRGL